MHGPPRAVLLDLNMPVMDGFEFLHALREKPGCGDIPGIVYSARDLSREDRDRLKDADRIVSKTASLSELTGELRTLAPPSWSRVQLSGSAGAKCQKAVRQQFQLWPPKWRSSAFAN